MATQRIETLEEGAFFWSLGDLHIKCDEETEDGDWWCVRTKDGCMLAFDLDDQVQVAKVTIQHEDTP